LHGKWELTHLIQEQGSTIGVLDQAVMVSEGAGERPLFIAQESAFHECFREGGAVHHHKWAIGSGAVVVNGPGKELLSRSRFSRDEHTGIASSGHGQQFQAGFHPPAVSHNILKCLGLEVGRGLIGRLSSTILEGPDEGSHHCRKVGAFFDIFPGAILDRPLRFVGITPVRQNDYFG